MTTLDPGASVVFTQGLRLSPRSTALRASSAAPSITCGLDVLVHDVIAAITTAPWSSSNSAPSSPRTCTGALTRPPAPTAALSRSYGASAGSLQWPTAGESLAGNDSALDSSCGPLMPPLVGPLPV